MSTLLSKVNDQHLDLPIGLAAPRYLGTANALPITCTPATAAIATTFQVVDDAGDNPGPGIETAGDPTDPANNQVNY